MDKPRHGRGDFDRIEHQAAGWMLRRDRGLTASEQDEFCQWLAADRRHGSSFARHAQNWERLDQLTDWRPPHSSRPNADLLALGPKRIRWVMPLSLAAAAAVAIIFLRRPRPVAPPASPPPAPALTLIEGRSLEDGSEVQLNRGGSIAVDFSPGERLVHLVRGEAHFEVAKNPLRPFIVEAGGIRIRAVGTAFDVRFGERAVDVLVTEGRVRVDGPDAETAPFRRRQTGIAASIPAVPILEAGQRAVVSTSRAGPPPKVTSVSADQIRELLAWRPRLLDFTAAPLSDIVAEFNRHNLMQLRVAERDLAALRISASFRSDNIEGFVALLKASFGVRDERRGMNEIVLYKSQ